MKYCYLVIITFLVLSCTSKVENKSSSLNSSSRFLTAGFEGNIWKDQEFTEDSIPVYDNYVFKTTNRIASIDVYLDNQKPLVSNSKRDVISYYFSFDGRIIYSEKLIGGTLNQRRVFNDSLYGLLKNVHFDSLGNASDTIYKKDCCPACFPCNDQ